MIRRSKISAILSLKIFFKIFYQQGLHLPEDIEDEEEDEDIEYVKGPKKKVAEADDDEDDGEDY